MEQKSKYFSVKSLDLARALRFITMQSYMIFDDFEKEGRKVYSFENTEKLQDVLLEITKLKNYYYGK